MKKCLKKNRTDLAISVVGGYILYFIMMKILKLSIVCPPEQKAKCILFGWLVFLVLYIVSSAFVFGTILLIKRLLRSFSKK